MDDKKEEIGLPSSLVDDAIGSMELGDSQKAVNVRTSSDERLDDYSMNAQKGGASGILDEIGRGIESFDSDIGSSAGTVDPGLIRDLGDQQYGFGLLDDVKGSTGVSGTVGGSGQNVVMESPIKQESVDFIKWFSELKHTDVKIAGGKGASLGEMFNSKFPVPNGFVITAQVFEFFLKNARLSDRIKEMISRIDVDNTEELNIASKKIREMIESSEIPKEIEEEIIESYHLLSDDKIDQVGVSNDALNILKNSQEPVFVSVRSSATTEDLADASFAGQQESFLNVKGDASLIEHVKRCMSSLFTPRAIYYRNKKGFSDALIAIVVQKMIDSEKSGVVFSKDPVRHNDNVAIEAVYGLGEGIVSGKIQPDNYDVSGDLKVENIKVANKKIAIVRTASGKNDLVRLSPERSKSQVLSTAEIIEVADFALKLEKHYDKPQDVEFAIEHGEVFIIQSRPITTLGNKQESKQLSGNVILEGLAASPGIGVGVVRIIKSVEELIKIKKGDVLVTEMTNPDMVVSMQKSVAIVTDEGGMTSHAAIVSREMGIPAIVGTGEATSVLKDGMKITVDGFNGKVYEGEVAETTFAEVKKAVETEKIKLKVILDLPDYADRVADSGIKSIGLMRLEGVIASSGKHPLLYEKEGNLEDYSKLLEEGIKKIMKNFNSIWIRSSDIRTDEFSSLKGAPEREINPMLGFHGVRFSLKHPEILKAELKAVKEAAEFNPDKKFGIMFPQIISMEEVREVKRYFNQVKTSNMVFGVMIETPASVQIIDEICEEVDFISFGTNDLTQFTLAVDRGEDNVQYLYNELHPALFSQIKKVIEACKKSNVETSICGQAGSKKEMVEFLFENGIDSISVNADAALEISELIRDMEVEWKSKEDERVREEEVEIVRKRQLEREKEEEMEKDRIRLLEKEQEDELEKQKIDNERLEKERLEKERLEKERIDNERVDGREVGLEKEKIIDNDSKIQSWDIKAVSIPGNVRVAEEVKMEEVGNLSEEEERIRRKKLKKIKKFKKWKERKRKRKEEERAKEMDSISEGIEKRDSWGEKAQVGLSDFDENSDVEETNEYDVNNLLDNVEISAESIQDHKIDSNERDNEVFVEPIDDIDRIEEISEKIEENVKEDNSEELEKRHRDMDNIETESERVDEDFDQSENSVSVSDNDGDYSRWDNEVNDDVENKKKEENNLNETKDFNHNSEENTYNSMNEEKNNEETESYDDSVKYKVENEEANKMKEEDSNKIKVEEETIGSISGEIEDIGVYNPDKETDSEEKKKYNYDFDDFE